LQAYAYHGDIQHAFNPDVVTFNSLKRIHQAHRNEEGALTFASDEDISAPAGCVYFKLAD
jgi:hypothetical protein